PGRIGSDRGERRTLPGFIGPYANRSGGSPSGTRSVHRRRGGPPERGGHLDEARGQVPNRHRIPRSQRQQSERPWCFAEEPATPSSSRGGIPRSLANPRKVGRRFSVGSRVPPRVGPEPPQRGHDSVGPSKV